MPFCPNCKYEYVEGIKRCPDCDVDLVEKLPEPPEPMSEPFVSVFTAADEMEAKIVRGLLEDAGIPVWEKGDSVETVYPFGVGELAEEELAVPESRVDEAKKVIEQAIAAGEETGDAEVE